MNETALWFYNANEPYASAFFEFPERNRFFRFSHAQRRYWDNCALAPYQGSNLYPSGKNNNNSYTVFPDYSYTFSVNWDELEKKGEYGLKQMKTESDLLHLINGPHAVGGNMYTHSLPNYKRIITEGLDSYEQRVQNLFSSDFKDGLQEVLTGIRSYHNRILLMLKKSNASTTLLRALEKVPFSPASSLYEALVAWNFIYYIDGCDNPGRIDADLIDFYKGEDVTEILREFYINVDQNDGWSSALGPECNPLTLQCLKAIPGLHRPSLELRVTPNTPKEIWDACIETIQSGSGQPAFYCEENYQTALALRFPHIPKEDLLKFNGGGCTETMLEGISNVGSLDAGINIAHIFYEYMQKSLLNALHFKDFYEGLIAEINKETVNVLDMVSECQKQRAVVRPQPVRTLLIDDCIDKGLDYNAGGARYYWSVINIAGIINVIDSLLAIKELIFEKKMYSVNEFLSLLKKEDKNFYIRLRSCPCFGVDDENADNLAADFSMKIFEGLNLRTPYLGGAFLPASIQFATYSEAGKNIQATPDGRRNGEPLCDSIGAIHGKDILGATALLNSVAKLHQNIALGTPVLNLLLQKQYIKKALQSLVTGYFVQGGMQIQISCMSKQDILDAMSNPEKHENLIVRIGGYSEYFNRLSPDLQNTVLMRTEHGF